MTTLFPVIHEDQDVLVINKPADLVCHPSKDGELSSLIGRVRRHLGEAARPHLVNRLDRETSGVILVAKTDEAARELRRLWETRRVRKEYLAIVHGHVLADGGSIDAPLGKDGSSRVAIRDCVRPDGAESRTDYQVIRRSAFRRDSAGHPHPTIPFTLLSIQPRTGRKHQIRIHLAHLGHPIVGDKIYGGDEDAYLAMVERRLTAEQRARLILPHQALHAASVTFEWRGSEWSFACEPEEWFTAFVGNQTVGRQDGGI